MIIKVKGQLVFHGKITDMYGFTPYTLDEKFPKLEAIYIFTKQVATRQGIQFKRLYVGETNNLATVIKDHEDSLCLKQHGVDSICVRLDSNKTSRRQKMLNIIYGQGDRPPCNITEKLCHDQTLVNALKHILKAYPYLEYDEDETKRVSIGDTDMLKIKVTDSRNIGVSVGSKIVSELSKTTGINFTHPNPLNNPDPRSKREYLTIMEIPRSDQYGTPPQKGSQ